MTLDIFLAYFHFVALIGTASFLAVELVLCRPGLAGDGLHRLKRVDIAYFGFAIAAVSSGAARLFWGAKGSAFYLGNPVFHAKLGLFVLVALLSIWPTARFIQWSKAALGSVSAVPGDAAVARVRNFLWLELVVLAAIPLLAVMMARGVSGFR